MYSHTVSVQNLAVRRRKTTVLDGLSFNLDPGSITGLIGPSGCGKTTLMRSIVGSQKTAGGTIEVLGRPAGHRDLRRRMAYTSQSLSIYVDISVRANVEYFARLLGHGPQKAHQAIERVHLIEHADQRIDQLSGGQASRASLACALVGNPEVLILDEPTVGLDPLTRESLWDSFQDLAANGKTLLISSHVMDEATRCGNVLFMREGSMLAHESISRLQKKTKTKTAEAAFLALINKASA